MKEIIARATEVLKRGGLILYPTDTVWGIGCDATNEEAVAKVFALKRRSDSKSLVLLATDMDMIARYIREIPAIAEELVSVNDKPMTIIYPGAEGLAPNTIAEDGSVGIRIPSHDFCLGLLRSFGRPIVSTSANISGGRTPRSYDEIADAIREGVDYTVDPSLEKGATGQASQIIKLGRGGEVAVIRA